MDKNRIYIQPCGDISIFFNGEWYEYDSFSNRYYRLDNGTTVNSPNGKLAKRRITKKYFEEVKMNLKEEVSPCLTQK